VEKKVWVEVANHGRQPAAISAVGLSMRPAGITESLLRFVRRGTHFETWAELRTHGDLGPIVLEPGHVHSAAINTALHVELAEAHRRPWRLRTFALDSRGRRAFSPRFVLSPSDTGILVA
jgi:hypothetical protein